MIRPQPVGSAILERKPDRRPQAPRPGAAECSVGFSLLDGPVDQTNKSMDNTGRNNEDVVTAVDRGESTLDAYDSHSPRQARIIVTQA